MLPIQGGEKLEEGERVTSLRWQMLSVKMMAHVPERQSRSELCQQHLLAGEESNPGWKVWFVHLPSCGSE